MKKHLAVTMCLLFVVSSLSGCYGAEEDEFSDESVEPLEDIMTILEPEELAQAPQQAWISTVSGSQEESHGHFIMIFQMLQQA